MVTAIGYHTVDKWNSDMLAVKINELLTVIDDETAVKGTDEDEANYDAVVKALKAKKKIEIIADEETDEEEAPAPAKKKKIAAAKPEADDEDEDEDEEEESDEDEDEDEDENEDEDEDENEDEDEDEDEDEEEEEEEEKTETKPANKKDKKAVKKTTTKPAPKAAAKKKPAAKAKPDTVERDKWGSKVGSEAAAINTVLMKGKALSLPEIREKTGNEHNWVWNHLNLKLVKGGFITRLKDGKYKAK